jgi:hypothetical protein
MSQSRIFQPAVFQPAIAVIIPGAFSKNWAWSAVWDEVDLSAGNKLSFVQTPMLPGAIRPVTQP